MERRRKKRGRMKKKEPKQDTRKIRMEERKKGRN